jgi:short-subunit dehydrogenase
MEGWADTLRLELANTDIHVILIEPGPITTDIRRKSIPHFEKWINYTSSARVDDYENIFKPRLYDESGKLDKFELPPEEVTKAVVKALTATAPKPRYRITVPTKMMAVLKRVLSTRMLDKVLLKA